MEIFVPGYKDLNPYFEEITHHWTFSVVYGHFSEYKPCYKFVVIHWPESIFNHLEPTNEDLVKFRIHFDEWKKNSKIIYVVHNLQRHKGMTPNFKELYNIVRTGCHAMVHLGKYSKELFEAQYPEKRHFIIPHPLYEKSYKNYGKKEARSRLGIDQNAMVIIAPGKIRTSKERKLLLEAFNKLSIENKVLIATNMKSRTIIMDFPGRLMIKPVLDLKKIIEAHLNWRLRKPEYLFSYSHISEEDLSLRMSAADIVFVPRLDILNSGNLYLGLTFKKIVVGPAIGNVAEILEYFCFPSFNPEEEKTVTRALKKAVLLFNANSHDNCKQKLTKFSSQNVAHLWENLFLRIEKVSKNCF